MSVSYRHTGAFSCPLDGGHRYHLTRTWGSAGTPAVLWIMLNPSDADAYDDDPTIRKIVGFTERMGHQSLDVLNLFSFRSSDPSQLAGVECPNGRHADAQFMATLTRGLPPIAKVVYAWGTKVPRGHAARVPYIDRLVRSHGHVPMALKLTKDGHPHHPLYLAYGAPPVSVPLLA